MNVSGDDASVILVAEDDEEDRLLMQRAMSRCRLDINLRFVENGEEVLDYLYRRGKFAPPEPSPRPSLVLLDLKMPRKDGKETLQELKSDPHFRNIPVIIMTTSSADSDVHSLYALGANSYITKPARFKTWIEIVEMMKMYWFELVALPSGGECES